MRGLLPDKLKDADISFETAHLNNGQSYNSIIIMAKDEAIAPRINIDNLYSDWLNGDSLDYVAMDICNKREAADKDMYDKQKAVEHYLNDPDSAREHIVRSLVNTEYNKDSLVSRPHEEMADMSYVYHIAVEGKESASRVEVTYDLMEKLGIEEKELKTLSERNTAKLEPAKVETLYKMLDLPIEEDEPQMIVITNESGVYGASAVLYPETDEKIRDYLKGDYYILPSSVHEVIAVKKDSDRTLINLRNMVRDVNTNEVDISDRLSNNVYERNGDVLEIAKTAWERSTERDVSRPAARSSEIEL